MKNSSQLDKLKRLWYYGRINPFFRRGGGLLFYFAIPPLGQVDFSVVAFIYFLSTDQFDQNSDCHTDLGFLL